MENDKFLFMSSLFFVSILLQSVKVVVSKQQSTEDAKVVTFSDLEDPRNNNSLQTEFNHLVVDKNTGLRPAIIDVKPNHISVTTSRTLSISIGNVPYLGNGSKFQCYFETHDLYTDLSHSTNATLTG